MAAFFSEELVSEVISANDIVDVVSGYVKLKRSGNSYMGCCPFHKEKTPSFHVSADKQLYHCFGCNAGGSVMQFIMNAEGLDFPDALRFLAERAGIRLPEDEEIGKDNEKYKRKQRIYEMNREAARFFREGLLSEKGQEARDYLTKRGLLGKTIAQFGIGYSVSGWNNLRDYLMKKGYSRDLMVEAGLCIRNEKGNIYDRFRERVMYPIIDVKGNIVGFGGRILKGDGAKYMNSPESIVYDKGKNLFALNIAKKSTCGYYILVEGYMDVISLHQAGITAAVAGCGTALTREQGKLISKNPVYLCYDSDQAGQKALERAAQIFSEFDTKIRVITITGAKDADEFILKYGKNKFLSLIENAKTVTEHRIDLLLSGVDLNNTSEKIEMLTKASQILSSITSAVEREVYINRLSAKSGISVDAINGEVRKINAKNAKRELKGELRRTVSSVTAANEKKSSRRERAEASLLSMMAEDEKVYSLISEKVSEESFSKQIHTKIWENINAYYNENKDGRCDDFLLSSMKGSETELSKVLMSVSNVTDNMKAAEDFLKILQDEIFNEKLEKAQNEGDIKKISELLRLKKDGGF